jgi:hypothetical protein
VGIKAGGVTTNRMQLIAQFWNHAFRSCFTKKLASWPWVGVTSSSPLAICR